MLPRNERTGRAKGWAERKKEVEDDKFVLDSESPIQGWGEGLLA
jgi:hypothetical protein